MHGCFMQIELKNILKNPICNVNVVQVKVAMR